MNMRGDSRARAFSDVHPYIQSVGRVELAQMLLAFARQQDLLDQDFVSQLTEGCHMRVWHHHDVSRGVRKPVHYDEVMGSPKDYHMVFVVARSRRRAKDAFARIPGGDDVMIPPGSPQEIHRVAYGFGICSGAGGGGAVTAGVAELFTTSLSSLLGLK